MFENLKDKYLGIVANDAGHIVTQATKRMFEDVLDQKEAVAPSARSAATLSMQRPEETEAVKPVLPLMGPVPAPYLPAAPSEYRIEEEKLRSMARWKASVNLKYIETITRFTRDIVGSMAATDAMMEMIERLERNDEALSPEDIEIAEGMKKAVEQRRKIEQTKSVILSDAEMRSIYEEIIFQQMREQNRRGELQLQSEKEFFWNLMLITMAEIGGAGKEVIAEKVTGAVKKVTANRR